MNFAPYQSSPPEHGRVSPDRGASPRASLDATIRTFTPVKVNPTQSPPPLQHPQPQRSWNGLDGRSNGWGADERAAAMSSTTSAMPGAFPIAEVSEFDTSLGIRLDYEASLAYLAIPPIGSIVLLILERNSDFVRYLAPMSCAAETLLTSDRFHSWQSSLLFTFMMVFHLLISWSHFLSWLLFIVDLGLMASLAYKAFCDAEILDRYDSLAPCDPLSHERSLTSSNIDTKFPFSADWRPE